MVFFTCAHIQIFLFISDIKGCSFLFWFCFWGGGYWTHKQEDVSLPFDLCDKRTDNEEDVWWLFFFVTTCN